MLSNRLIRLVLVTVLVMLAAVSIREVVATSTAVKSIPVSGAELEVERSSRSLDAEASRWNAIANYYSGSQAQDEENIQHYWAAEAARWNAMAEYYLKSQSLESGRSQRSLDAEIARWNAITEYYSGK